MRSVYCTLMVSDEQLLEDLREFADTLGRTPTSGEMYRKGPHGRTSYYNYFGSWNEALESAGLEINKEDGVSKKRLLEDLHEFADGLGETPSATQMNKSGPWDSTSYIARFDSWNNALKKAGLEINRLSPSEIAGTGKQAFGRGYTEARRRGLHRDNHQCRVCDSKEQLHCHHIKPRRTFDDVSESNTVDNLITLCPTCHGKFEGRWQDADPDEFAENAQEVLS